MPSDIGLRAHPAGLQSLERSRLGHAVVRAVWSSGRLGHFDRVPDDRSLGAWLSPRRRPDNARFGVADLRMAANCKNGIAAVRIDQGRQEAGRAPLDCANSFWI